MTFSIGCSIGNSNKNEIAYVSQNADSEYYKVLNNLGMGSFFDFKLKFLDADKRRISIWVEGYINGKAVEPSHLVELSYGLDPGEVVNGQIGFGIIEYNDNRQIFLKTEMARTAFQDIDNNLLISSNPRSLEYVIGSKPVGLESGEEVLLAVFRQQEGSLKPGFYDYTDLNSIKQMIRENSSVLLLKVKVERK